MSRIWNFHGGVHPPENKAQSLQQPLRRAPIPEKLILPVQQHIGAPAVPTVKVGDHVLKGQVIAEPNGAVSVFMHAPTSGTISAIGDFPLPHPSAMNGLCIEIETDGKDEWCELTPIADYKKLSKDHLVEKIRQAGISGMGGAGFPTSVKLNLREDHIINTLILNGVECEPYITADDTLMREYAAEVIAGIEIVNRLIDPTHILVGIEDNKPEAAVAITEAAQKSRLSIEVVVVPTKYPSGGERQLIQLLTGVEVPHGQLPADIGIVVQNIGTAVAIHDAVHEGKPLISRITTMTGEALTAPGNIEVLLGTPIEDLLSFCGCNRPSLSRLIMGGPMMGFTLESTAIPVIKTTNCIIAGTDEEFPPAPIANPCIRCGACEQACPVELLPQQLYWFSKGQENEKAIDHNIMDCIECGACSYVCPSHIPLVQYYRHTKAEIRKEQHEHQKAERARERFEARKARMEAAEQEKEARRKARAEAAAKSQAKKRDAALKKPEASADKAAPAEVDIKQLKTAAAIARTKLKKLEKAVTEAETNGSEELASLQQELASTREKTELAQQQLADAEAKAATAETPTTKASPVDDINALKVAAAKARTKVTKTEKVLADAEEKGAPTAEKLRTSLEKLKADAKAADDALAKAESVKPSGASAANTNVEPATQTATTVDPKVLKTAAAIARTKFKKAQKALEKAKEEGAENIPELETELIQLEQTVQDAEAAFAQVENATTPATSAGVDLKALKTAAAVARTKLKKTEKALADAREKDSPALANLEKAVGELQQKAKEAEDALAQAEK